MSKLTSNGMEHPEDLMKRKKEAVMKLMSTPDSRWLGFTDPEGHTIRLADADGHLIAPLDPNIEDRVKDCYERFEAKDRDVWIVSYPRSGIEFLEYHHLCKREAFCCYWWLIITLFIHKIYTW